MSYCQKTQRCRINTNLGACERSRSVLLLRASRFACRLFLMDPNTRGLSSLLWSNLKLSYSSYKPGGFSHNGSSTQMKRDNLGDFEMFDPAGDVGEEMRAFVEAQRVRSLEIDESLQETKRNLDRRKKAVHVLLLGQSESGKSSVLKNFHLAFAPRHFHSERAIWKTIIQLNLIGSIKTLLEILKEEWESSEGLGESSPLNPDLRRIRLGLSPLLFMETSLLQMISPENKARDICVRSGWKSLMTGRRSKEGKPRSQSQASENDPTFVLAASKEDIIVLWEDPTVRQLLRRRRVRLEDAPGFFLNDVARIATLDYEPTDSDIIRARVRTMGIEEHHFVIEKGVDAGAEVYITDVGGVRSSRASWIPYFENIPAILFLAPLAFNQLLEEDPRINRLEDSLTLWREICMNKLLAGSHLILFLNKKDVLCATLDAGVRVKKYVPSYGDAPNDINHVTKYFKDKFHAYQRKLSPRPRPFVCFETSAVDTSSMAALLVGVREIILRQRLKDVELI